MTGQPTTPISHAEMIAAVQRWIDRLDTWANLTDKLEETRAAHLAELEKMQAVLAHLERMQPTDTQADLTHALRFAIQLAEAEGYSECAAGLREITSWIDNVAAVLQSEREAAAAEARRAALEEAARLVDHHPFADNAEADCMDAQGCCEMMAAQIRELASPPDPQEE